MFLSSYFIFILKFLVFLLKYTILTKHLYLLILYLHSYCFPHSWCSCAILTPNFFLRLTGLKKLRLSWYFQIISSLRSLFFEEISPQWLHPNHFATLFLILGVAVRFLLLNFSFTLQVRKNQGLRIYFNHCWSDYSIF